MKKLLFFLLISYQIHAANYFRIGSAGLNWSNVGSWSSTSGGASNGSAQPTSSDNVTFDSNSPASVTVTGAANTNNLTLNKASLVITLNGGSITVAGLLTTGTNAPTINKTASETVTCQGGLTSAGSFSGTAKVIITGGTWDISGGSGISIDVDLQGTVTVASPSKAGGTITYVSGTITTTGGTLKITGSSTLNTNGVTWNNVTLSGVTVTLTSNLSISGLLTTISSATAAINKTASETVTCSGGITTQSGTNTLGGTAKYILTGGTWTGTNSLCSLTADVDIQGNVTIATNVYYSTGTLKYVSGTVTTTSSTLNLTGNCTLDTNGITWNAVTFTASCTATLNSLLTATTLTTNNTTSNSFAGTAGFTVSNFVCPSTAAFTITFKNGITYSVTSSLTSYLSRNGSTVLFTSDDGTLTAALNLTNGATCNVLADFTRITNNGRTINTFNGTVTSCSGVRSFSDLQTIGY
jgi:hypothetical protein